METTTYTQLTLMKESEMTPEQALFMQVHTEMVRAGEKATEALLILAGDMKKMRDEKLYLAAGFVDFRDYVQNALNIKERHAYNYIKLLDLAPDYLKANAGLGVTKLALIAGTSDEVREQLMAEEETKELSVRELTTKIKEQEKELGDRQQQITMLTEQLGSYQSEEPSAYASDEVTASEADKERIKELESKVAEAEKQAESAVKKMEKSKAEAKKLSEQLEELKAKPAPQPVIQTITNTETIEVDNPETLKELESVKNSLLEAEAEAKKAKDEKLEAEERVHQAETELATYKKTQEAVATFKIHASSLFETFENVLESVRQIKATDPALAQKCLGKLRVFSDNVRNSVEELQ